MQGRYDSFTSKKQMLYLNSQISDRFQTLPLSVFFSLAWNGGFQDAWLTQVIFYLLWGADATFKVAIGDSIDER